MNTQLITKILLITTIVGLTGYDLWVAIATPANDGDTISEVLLVWGNKMLVLPLWLGILGTHWFWPGKDLFTREYHRWIVLGIITILVEFTFGILDEYATVAAFFLGTIVGHTFWPQSDKK